MRKVFGIIALVLGVLLIVGAVLVKWVAAPALVKAPLDIDRVTVAEGQSQVFVLSSQSVATVPVVATRSVRGDKSAGTADVAVYDEILCLRSKQSTGADKDGCVPPTDPGFIQKTTDRIAFDRVTGLAVADGAKFGASVDGDPAIRHDGLGYTFPIDTQKKSYPFFDTVLGTAFPMKFQGTEKIDGLSVYRFSQQVPTSAIKINGILPGTYSNVRIVWVEPTTGIIVKGSEQITQKFQSGGGTAFEGTLVFNDATVKSQVDFANDQRRQVQIIRVYVPIGFAVGGVLLVLVGAVLIRRRKAPVADESVVDQAADVDRSAGEDRAPQR